MHVFEPAWRLPLQSQTRAALSLAFFVAAVNLYQGYLHSHNSYVTRESHSDQVRDAASEYIDVNRGQLENALGGGPYYLGESCNVLDRYLLMLSNWHEDTEALFARNPKL